MRQLLPFALLTASCLCGQEAPTHVILASHVAPEKRQASRDQLKGKIPALVNWRDRDHSIAGFQILTNSLWDDEGWDSIISLQLTPAWLGAWRRFDSLVPSAARATSVTPADLIESGSVKDARGGVFLVIPYEYLLSAAEYKRYAKGYVIPQLDGWLGEGALLGYQLFMARFPAGRSWNALLVLRYRDWAALGRRDAVTAKVRAQLANDAKWKAWSDNKQSFRREKIAVIAEAIAEP